MSRQTTVDTDITLFLQCEFSLQRTSVRHSSCSPCSMTTAHDILYPSPVRTHSLVMQGEYFVSLPLKWRCCTLTDSDTQYQKYMDDVSFLLRAEYEKSAVVKCPDTVQSVTGKLQQSLEGQGVWSSSIFALQAERLIPIGCHRWTQYPLRDAVWCMFHYVRLYISGFAFQAHVQRAKRRADDEAQATRAQGATQAVNIAAIFPAGGAASPDAPVSMLSRWQCHLI